MCTNNKNNNNINNNNTNTNNKTENNEKLSGSCSRKIEPLSGSPPTTTELLLTASSRALPAAAISGQTHGI